MTSGAKAQSLTAAANPNAAPPSASRRRDCVNPSPSNTATAPSRQNRFSQGSSRKVCEALSASG